MRKISLYLIEVGNGTVAANEGNQMKTLGLVVVGIRGSVVALNRQSGKQVWSTNLQSTEFVNVVMEEDRLFASTKGELFCLNPVTGEVLWNNRLKGHGTGLATIAASGSIETGSMVAMTQ